MFELALFLVSVLAAGVASVAGFGIGSLITPLLSLSIPTKLAVAMVSIPHLLATAMRFFMLRQHVNKRVLLGFGLMSALGGLLGALLHSKFATHHLTFIFGMILIFSGTMGLTGLSIKMNLHGGLAWFAGGISGMLGGLVGNQGGIRSAALLGLPLAKESFVATATAVGLIVDVARMPVYFFYAWHEIWNNNRLVLIMLMGVTIGTWLGGKVLRQISETVFIRLASILIITLGAFMLYKGLS